MPGCCGFRGVFWVRRDFFRFFFFERTRPAACMRTPCLICLYTSNEARPREQSDRGRFLPLGKKSLFIMRKGRRSEATEDVFLPIGKIASSYRGEYRVSLFSLSVCLSGCVCVTLVVFIECESCTRLISTTPGSMGAGEYGLTRGECFVARRLEVVAVAGLLWISWCVLGGADFSVFFFSIVFFSSNAHGLLQVRGRLALFTSLLVQGWVQGAII